MQPNRHSKYKVLAAIAASVALLAAVVQAESAGNESSRCVRPSTNLALCGKVGTDLHRCIRQKPCNLEREEQSPRGRSAIWILTDLFFPQD